MRRFFFGLVYSFFYTCTNQIREKLYFVIVCVQKSRAHFFFIKLSQYLNFVDRKHVFGIYGKYDSNQTVKPRQFGFSKKTQYGV